MTKVNKTQLNFVKKFIKVSNEFAPGGFITSTCKSLNTHSLKEWHNDLMRTIRYKHTDSMDDIRAKAEKKRFGVAIAIKYIFGETPSFITDALTPENKKALEEFSERDESFEAETYYRW